MSKVIKAIFGGGGGPKTPDKLKGKKREEYVQLAKEKYGPAAVPQFSKGNTWEQYVKRVESGGFAQPPAPAPAPAPFSFEFPSFTFPKMPEAQSIADRLAAESEAYGAVKAREVVASKAQGFNTRLRALGVDQQAPLLTKTREFIEEGEEGTQPLGLPTILGARSRGGQTSTRRKRLSQRY